MTTTSSATLATTPRSWVIISSAMPSSFCRSLIEPQDLGLDGDVERRRGFVGDQQRRPADQRHGDHGALAQAARQFERIGPQRALGIGETDHAQHGERQFVDLGAAELASAVRRADAHRMDVAKVGSAAMQLDRFADLVAHRVERRQRGHRLLEDDRDLAAADLAASPGRMRSSLAISITAVLTRGSCEQDRARRNCRRCAAAGP